jgi:hypothetical protein
VVEFSPSAEESSADSSSEVAAESSVEVAGSEVSASEVAASEDSVAGVDSSLEVALEFSVAASEEVWKVGVLLSFAVSSEHATAAKAMKQTRTIAMIFFIINCCTPFKSIFYVFY